jgi:hypothetical protein
MSYTQRNVIAFPGAKKRGRKVRKGPTAEVITLPARNLGQSDGVRMNDESSLMVDRLVALMEKDEKLMRLIYEFEPLPQ